MIRSRYYSLALAVWLIGAVGGGGCAYWRRVREPVRDLEFNGDALFFRGYRSTITVHASPEQVVEFFRRPANLTKLGVFKSVDRNQAGDITRVGQKVRGRMSVRGVEFPITFTNIKAAHEKDRYDLWVANSHPFLSIQRWRIQPGPEGSEVQFNLMSEEPASWAGRAVDSSELFEVFCKIMDTALAHLQAQFDPKFNLKAATGGGPQSELYQALLQTTSAESRVASPPAKVFDYLKSHNSFAGLLGETRVDAKCLGNLDLPYCPLQTRIAGRETPVNQFVAGYKVNEQITYLLVWADYVALVQVKIATQPKGRGSSVKAVFAVEVPGSALDLLLSLTKVPDRTARAMARMKQDLESGGRPAGEGAG